MDPAFANAITPRRHVCLRLRLFPLTVAHWFALARYCPALVGESKEKVFSLPLAVFICAHRQPPKLESFRIRLFFACWAIFCHALSAHEELQSFMAYFRSQSTPPQLNVRDEQVHRETGTPKGFWMLTFLMRDFGMSRQQAMEIPIIEALCLRAALAEDDGKIELRSERSRHLWDHVMAKRRN